jgi:transcriptional regulator with XRE-family HTH domain
MGLAMDISTIINNTPDTILQKIAERVRERRLERNLTQKDFSKRAGVGYDAYRRFENTGDITFRNLLLCAIVLDDIEGFTELFIKKSYQNIDELLKMEKVKKRKRGSKK